MIWARMLERALRRVDWIRVVVRGEGILRIAYCDFLSPRG